MGLVYIHTCVLSFTIWVLKCVSQKCIFLAEFSSAAIHFFWAKKVYIVGTQIVVFGFWIFKKKGKIFLSFFFFLGFRLVGMFFFVLSFSCDRLLRC